MERLKRKIYVDGQYKMINLYKMRGKLGTYCTTIFYFFEEPEVGKIIKCIHDINKPGVTDSNLMYQPIDSVYIDEIRSSDGFVFASLM